jgi:subtilisin family serine protease
MLKRTRFPLLISVVVATLGPLLGGVPAQAQQQGALSAREAARRAFHGSDRAGKDGPLAPVGMKLARLYYRAQQGGAAARGAGVGSEQALLPVQGGRVLVDAVAAEDDVVALRADLDALGLTGGATAGPVVSGWLPIAALAEAARLEALRFARPSLAKVRGRGARSVRQEAPVVSQGVRAMQADSAREAFGVNGDGVLVGILSDSFDCTGEATTGDVAEGELPSGVRIVEEEAGCGTGDETSGTDEGRAMGQIIFDVAPGANLAFNTAFGGIATFAGGICRLGGVGSNGVCEGTTDPLDAPAEVIVDDVINFAEPMFADGPVARAVDAVVDRGSAYFSAAGNYADQSYESEFRVSGRDGPLAGGPLHDFDPGGATDVYQTFILPEDESVTMSFQWAQPYPSAGAAEGASTDLDVFLLNPAGDTVEAATFDNIDRDPTEILSFENTTADTTFRFGIELVEGDPPDLMKYVFSSGATDVVEGGVSASTLWGHANAEGAEAVGAAVYYNTPVFLPVDVPVVNPFSSLGGTPILFENGNRLSSPETRRKPELVGPDGGNNSFFGDDLPNTFVDGTVIPGEDDSLPNFFGTSAAAPHVAGVAALMLSRNATRAPATLYQTLEETATDMDPVRNGTFDPGENDRYVGFDFKTGFGFVDALEAVSETPPSLEVRRASGGDLPAGGEATLEVVSLRPEDAEQFVVAACPGSCGIADADYDPLATANVEGKSPPFMLDIPLPEEAGRYTLRVRQVGGGGPRLVGTLEVTVALAEEDFALRLDGPNPFQEHTRLRLVAAMEQTVRAVLYDARGRRIKTLVEGRQVQANRQTFIRLAAGGLASGVYFVRVTGADFMETESVVLVQ